MGRGTGGIVSCLVLFRFCFVHGGVVAVFVVTLFVVSVHICLVHCLLLVVGVVVVVVV